MVRQTYGGVTTNLVRRVAVYVPGTCNVDRPAAQLQQQWTDTMLDFFSTLFGGATALRVHGCYRDSAGKLVREPLNMVFAFCDAAVFEMSGSAVVQLARDMGKDMGQECMAIEVDGALYLVTANSNP